MDIAVETPFIRLHPEDTVLIARRAGPEGSPVAPGILAATRIPPGHKVAIKAHAVGEPIRRYGQIIGFATQPIAPATSAPTATRAGSFDHWLQTRVLAEDEAAAGAPAGPEAAGNRTHPIT